VILPESPSCQNFSLPTLDRRSQILYNSFVHFVRRGGAMSPQNVSITELRQNLPSFLDRVAAGESFLVTVHGTIVARLAPETDPAEEAYARILHYRDTASLGDVLAPLDGEWTHDRDHL
jgi:prevent-host-death family protein